ncbi:TetR/AcrR family transcriptional regulator [Actinokineospora pegani]|uniref:TetR/AcrR family transcriptional regulator n=1 Tax=Actinokineospora pegani TaxID=2654637 RepID=UPI0012EAFCF7|nr:TetR family transcriptional regulator C-terminal domain-containing protein [Actinokineospora pegani]
MPRVVDHEQRRAGLAAAVVRVAARDGLHAATMRSVAAEAGVSFSLVQYYFDTKAALLRAALDHLEAEAVRRWADRLAALPERSPRAVVEAFLDEALPTTPDSRAHHVVWTAYAALSMTGTGLPTHAGPDRRERELAGYLEGAVDDPGLEAARLLALAHGLGTSVLIGRMGPPRARAVLALHLDAIL